MGDTIDSIGEGRLPTPGGLETSLFGHYAPWMTSSPLDCMRHL